MNRTLCGLILWLSLIGPVMAEPPSRIISLAPNVTEVLYDLGLGGRVIAVSRYCNYPPAAGMKPKVGGMSNPSLETIVALKPEMVVLTDNGNPRTIERKLRSLAIRTHIFRARRLNELPGEIRALGAALGVQNRADHSAGRIEDAIRRYAVKEPPSSVRPPQKILFVVQPEPLLVAGPGTAIDDVLRLLGLQNIAAHAGTAYPRFSLEEIIRQSPDIILIGKSHEGGMAQSERFLKKLGQIEAVRRGHVYTVGDPLFRLGPRIAEGIAEITGIIKRGE